MAQVRNLNSKRVGVCLGPHSELFRALPILDDSKYCPFGLLLVLLFSLGDKARPRTDNVFPGGMEKLSEFPLPHSTPYFLGRWWLVWA
jgi:hypothetical protein